VPAWVGATLESTLNLDFWKKIKFEESGNIANIFLSGIV
jgi:hypothetical protein